MAMYAEAQTAASRDINEDLELNIIERRIQETDFSRSMRADLQADDLRLLVGVGADAGRIDVTIRGVTGRVRFHASLERIRQRIAQLRSNLIINSR
jgi:hypothetical protein